MKYLYTYKVVKENVETGQQAKRTKLCIRYNQLSVGSLYMHLGAGFPGAQRVLELVSKEEITD